MDSTDFAPGSIHSATPGQLTVRLLHDLLHLRIDVFVVEQECAYPELDGRDLLTGTRHLWIEDSSQIIIATLRLLDEGECTRIGRVATRADHRGYGHAGALLSAALDLSEGPWTLSAQTHLQHWYEGFGFVADGPEFVEDGIAHVPMRRERVAEEQRRRSKNPSERYTG